MISYVSSVWSATWSVHGQTREQCMISHVISAWYPCDQCMINHVISVWSATWTVHAQSRDPGLLSCVISVCSSAWQLPAELHDSCLSSPWQLPPVLRNSCLLIYLIIASWAAWFLRGEFHDYSLLTDSCLDNCHLCLVFFWFHAASIFYCFLNLFHVIISDIPYFLLVDQFCQFSEFYLISLVCHFQVCRFFIKPFLNWESLPLSLKRKV